MQQQDTATAGTAKRKPLRRMDATAGHCDRSNRRASGLLICFVGFVQQVISLFQPATQHRQNRPRQHSTPPTTGKTGNASTESAQTAPKKRFSVLQSMPHPVESSRFPLFFRGLWKQYITLHAQLRSPNFETQKADPLGIVNRYLPFSYHLYRSTCYRRNRPNRTDKRYNASNIANKNNM